MSQKGWEGIYRMKQIITKKKATKEYSKYKKLIYHIAWDFHRKYGNDVEDLISTGNYIYCRICHNNEYNIDTSLLPKYIQMLRFSFSFLLVVMILLFGA